MNSLPYPDLGKAIDGYDHPVVPASCSPTKQPGVVAFSRFVLSNLGGVDSGIVRACSVGKPSDHHEGRAWDWGVSAYREDDVARVKVLVDWLLATDRYGNEHANLRRSGIVYFIWDRQIWGTMSKTWKPYSGASPHRDHVHISFGWPGAKGETSLYSWLSSSPFPPKPTPPPDNPPPPPHTTEESRQSIALPVAIVAGAALIARRIMR